MTKGAELNRPLFDRLGSRYIADPDVVISKEAEVLLVLDTKYKQIDNYPDHGDVYQLFAHCTALSAQTGLLVYPAAEPQVHALGTAVSQVEVHWAGVRIGCLRDDLEMIVKELIWRSRSPGPSLRRTLAAI